MMGIDLSIASSLHSWMTEGSCEPSAFLPLYVDAAENRFEIL